MDNNNIWFKFPKDILNIIYEYINCDFNAFQNHYFEYIHKKTVNNNTISKIDIKTKIGQDLYSLYVEVDDLYINKYYSFYFNYYSMYILNWLSFVNITKNSISNNQLFFTY